MTEVPETATVAVYRESTAAIELQRAPMPAIEPGSVVVKIRCCTLCGSDLHTFHGRRISGFDGVLGHEIIGTVVALGKDTGSQLLDHLRIGDRVTWSIAASCFNCRFCQQSIPQKCEHLFKYGHEDFKTEPFSGGLGEYCVLKPGTTIQKLPHELSDKVACPANCATSTVAAAFRTAGTVEGQRVVIFGAGMLGLTACAFATHHGAAEVFIQEPDAARRDLAKRFGAHGRMPTERPDCDVAFEFSGHSTAVSEAIESVGIGGRVILVGSVSPGPAVPIDPESVVRRMVSIHGVHNYIPEDLATAVEFLMATHDRFAFESLIEKSFPLAEVSDAFHYAETQRPIRVAVIPD